MHERVTKERKQIGCQMRAYLAICSMMAVAILAACGSEPVAKKATPSPVPAATILSPDAVAIDKPVNVSFSTYSQEWPVGWMWIDPDQGNPTRKNVKKGVLSVTIPTGKDLVGDVRTAPRYIKAIKGDFQIDTSVKFSPVANYQGAGLLIYKDENNYLRFERGYGGVGGSGSGLRIDVRKGDDQTSLVTTDDLRVDLPEVELKIVRSGRIFTAFWREDENSEWREAGEFESDYPETVFAGLVACNTAREATVEFGYIRLLPAIRK